MNKSYLFKPPSVPDSFFTEPETAQAHTDGIINQLERDNSHIALELVSQHPQERGCLQLPAVKEAAKKAILRDLNSVHYSFGDEADNEPMRLDENDDELRLKKGREDAPMNRARGLAKNLSTIFSMVY